MHWYCWTAIAFAAYVAACCALLAYLIHEAPETEGEM